MEMAEGIDVEDAPVFKTRDEIMKTQQVHMWTDPRRYLLATDVPNVFMSSRQGRWPVQLYRPYWLHRLKTEDGAAV